MPLQLKMKTGMKTKTISFFPKYFLVNTFPVGFALFLFQSENEYCSNALGFPAISRDMPISSMLDECMGYVCIWGFQNLFIIDRVA